MQPVLIRAIYNLSFEVAGDAELEQPAGKPHASGTAA